MNHITKTRHGFRTDIRLPWDPTRRYRRTFPTAREAQAFINRLLERSTGSSIADAADQYITWSADIKHKSPLTVRRDRQRIRIFVQWAESQGITDLAAVGFAQIAAFQKYFYDNAPFDKSRVLKRYKPLNIPSSWEHYRASINTFFNWCRKRNLVHDNPLGDPDFRVKLQRQIPPHFEPEELALVFEYFDERDAAQPVPWFSVMFRLLAYTGMRLGEVCDLTWTNVDLKAGTISITRSKNKGVRVIPFNTRLRPWLDRLPRKTRRLFDNGHGRPLYSQSWILRQLVKACAAVNIPRRRVHDLRHTFGASLARARVSLPEIQRLMGHDTIQSTMIYIVFYPDDLRNAVESLDY